MEFDSVYEEEIRDNLASQFSQLASVTNLYHAGATLPSKTQLENVPDQLKNNLFFNPHITCAQNMSIKAEAEARRMVLRHFNADPR